MTIRKGEEWGSVGSEPADTVTVATDAEARALAESARRDHQPVAPLRLLGGDLARTIGVPARAGAEPRPDPAPADHQDRVVRLLPVDLGAVLLDGRLFWFVASLVAGRPLGRGHSYAVMNAAWLAGLNLAPKAHPNDGLLDIVDATLALRQSLQARRRARLGDHLPHPGIRLRRTAAEQVTFPRPTAVRLDGVPVGRFRSVSVRCEPDALTVVL